MSFLDDIIHIKQKQRNTSDRYEEQIMLDHECWIESILLNNSAVWCPCQSIKGPLDMKTTKRTIVAKRRMHMKFLSKITV